MINSIFLLIFGLLLLIAGGEFLVKSAVSFAKKLNVSPLLIGLTVVSFGTSAPELMVSLQAAFDNAVGISIGNIIGSNIANIGLVLGLTAFIKPLLIEKSKYILSWIVMILSSVTLMGLLYDGVISFNDGMIFLTCLFLFIFLSVKFIKKEEIDVNKDDEKGILVSIALLLSGAAGLYFGSELFISSSIIIAQSIGISEFVIGVSIVAFGTSLPELVTSIVAAVRKQNSISIGNLIGSNIFNIFAVLGITAIIKPLTLASEPLTFYSLVIMLVFALLMGVYLFNKKISRLKGLILVAGYIIYIVFIIVS